MNKACLLENTKQIVLVVTLGSALLACAVGRQKIMSRQPQLYQSKKGDKFEAVKHGPGVPKVLVKKTRADVKIHSADVADSQGSLAMIENRQNRLFLTSQRPVVGDYIDVKVVNHLAKKVIQEDEKKGEEKAELDEDELIKMLPKLEPADSKTHGILKNIKMKIVHNYANGDVLLAYRRKSVSVENEKDLLVHARLPYQYLDKLDQVNTASLSDVRLTEAGNEETLQKTSSSWEDEYTMRLSGFSEARSKHAADLESKRIELDSVRSGLMGRLKSLGVERKQMAKQRDDWLKKRSKTSEKIESLNQEVLRQKQLLDKSKEALDARNLELKSMQPLEGASSEKATVPEE